MSLRTIGGRWYDEEINKSWKKFTKKKKVSLFIGTWNVNAKPPTDSLESWLLPPGGMKQPDLYVLGFQEIVDLNAANLWIENDANLAWEDAISKTIDKSYTKIAGRHLVGILLLIYARKEILPYCSDILVNTCGVGLFGTAGNKGGVGVHMKVFDSHLCFICAHLAAHKNNVAGRNSDYSKILENLRFTRTSHADEDANELKESGPRDDSHADHSEKLAGGPGGTGDSSSSGMIREVIGILEHDMIFWFGDLNYRLNFDSIETVYDLIEKKDWPALIAQDQLMSEKGARHAFDMFEEGQIRFRPTYKYQPKTSVYEKRPDKKTRFPAWCDRILWARGQRKTTQISDVHLHAYRVSMSQQMSDHKPVYTLMTYDANIFDLKKRAEVKEEVMKRLDGKTNDSLPRIKHSHEVTFPTIKYGEPEKIRFPIHNIGIVPVEYEFRAPDSMAVNGSSKSTSGASTSSAGPSLDTHGKKSGGGGGPPSTPQIPEWLRISPIQGYVLPGETTHVTFTIAIHASTVRQIMENGNKVEVIVILSIGQGLEKYIEVKASYLPSCFGNKIETLVKYKQPIRFLTGDHAGSSSVQASSSSLSGDTGTVLSIPKEIWRLVDYLYKYGMSTEQIFITRGIRSEISAIRECLDTGKQLGKYELHSVGETLVRFLESLQDPVFPASHCNSFSDDMDVTQWCRQALMSLPLSHYNTFLYIIAFLREVLKHTPRNHLSPDKLAFQFSSALTHSTVRDVGDLKTHKPFKIISTLLKGNS